MCPTTLREARERNDHETSIDRTHTLNRTQKLLLFSSLLFFFVCQYRDVHRLPSLLSLPLSLSFPYGHLVAKPAHSQQFTNRAAAIVRSPVCAVHAMYAMQHTLCLCFYHLNPGNCKHLPSSCNGMQMIKTTNVDVLSCALNRYSSMGEFGVFSVAMLINL